MRENILPTELVPDYKIKLIIKSINDAMPQYLSHVKNDKLITQNGKYHEIWNYIFKNIKNNFNNTPYKCYKISRGKLWEFIVIHDEEKKILFILMKEERFKEIKNDKNSMHHYIKIINSINNYMKPKDDEQLCLFKQDYNKTEYIEDELQSMIKDIIGKEIKICVNVLFSIKQNKVASISGNIFNYNLSKIKSYCWNKYIKADIDEIIDTEDEHNIENPPIELKIRENTNITRDAKKDSKKNNYSFVKSKKRKEPESMKND